MKLHLWGTDFRRSPSEFRSRLFVPVEKRAGTLKSLLELGFSDLVYLATCNRVEFYTTAPDYFSCTRSRWIDLLRHFDLPPESYYQGYHLEGKSALRHLLRVGASLESLVVGEAQILGQLKEAVSFAREQGIPLHPSLDRAFALCFQTAKKIRSETAIAEKPVSVANLGLREIQVREKEYPLERAVLVGRSPIMVATAQWLLQNRPDCMIVWVNRDIAALGAIAESQQAMRVSLEHFVENPINFTHLFTSTASADPLFGKAFFEKLSRGSRLFFDYAQPPDIQRGLDLSPWGKLLELEDFAREARQNAASREVAVARAEEWIDDALRSYCREQKEAPLLREFSAAEPHVFDELAEAVLLIEKEFPAAIQPQVKKWAEKLVKKNWHRSREHLRTILRKFTEPDEQVPVV